jgi:thiol-disulfide isomerase/thioredoxin
MNSWRSPLAPLALLALLVPVLTLAKSPSGAGTSPRFTLPTRSGTVSLDSLRGHVVLVDFWTSWCEPCRQSFPWMKTMHDRYAAKGLAIVAVNLDKDRAAAEAFLLKFSAPFTIAFDPSGKTAEDFQVKAMPTSFLIGPTGKLLYSHAGFDPKKTGSLETLIQEACTP